MTRKYSLLIEGDEPEYSAHVPELPAIPAGRKLPEPARPSYTSPAEL